MSRIRLTTGAALVLLIGLTGCSWFGLDKTNGALAVPSSDIATVPAYAVGDEPNAVEVGQRILEQGGSAADAATAMYFALAASYPVAAGLGGGGLCVVHDQASSSTASINFLARDSAGGGSFAVPGNVRGFAILQRDFGRLPWQRDVSPGEGLASAGFAISAALETRLRASQNIIRLDANLSAEFLDESGIVKPAGAQVNNADLGATLTAIRSYGPNALYRGAIAHNLVAYSATQGGAFTISELSGYPVVRTEPFATTIGTQTVYLPSANIGAGAFARALLSRVVDAQGQFAGGNPAAAIAAATKGALDQFGIKSLPGDLGATGFATADGTGQSVACGVTMNGPFGSGHTATGTGVVLAKAPSTPEMGLSAAFLTPALAVSTSGDLAMAAAGSGGPNGTAAVAFALLAQSLGNDITVPGNIHSTGLAPYETANIIGCENGVCAALPDPGAHGLGAIAQVPVPR